MPVATLAASLRNPPDTRNDDEEDFWGEKRGVQWLGVGSLRDGVGACKRRWLKLNEDYGVASSDIRFYKERAGIFEGSKGGKGGGRNGRTVGLLERWRLG